MNNLYYDMIINKKILESYMPMSIMLIILIISKLSIDNKRP